MSNLTFFLFFIPFLAILLLSINLIFAPHNPYGEKKTSFECGFHSFLGQNRTQFSISFFIFALLFLLFDLEILLIYPYSVSSYINGVYGLVVMLLFFILLTLGFIFELGKKALDIPSRQIGSLLEYFRYNAPKPNPYIQFPLTNTLGFGKFHLAILGPIGFSEYLPSYNTLFCVLVSLLVFFCVLVFFLVFLVLFYDRTWCHRTWGCIGYYLIYPGNPDGRTERWHLSLAGPNGRSGARVYLNSQGIPRNHTQFLHESFPFDLVHDARPRSYTRNLTVFAFMLAKNNIPD